jgi:hypothetical protein
VVRHKGSAPPQPARPPVIHQRKTPHASSISPSHAAKSQISHTQNQPYPTNTASMDKFQAFGKNISYACSACIPIQLSPELRSSKDADMAP